MGLRGWRRRRGLIVLVVTVGVALLGAPAALGATFTVVNTNDSGAGSLRQAILDSNGNVGVVDTIDFNITLPGEQVITPATALPVVTEAVVIDGSTQVDGSGFPLIRIDGGSDVAPSLYGLELNVTGIASSTVRKLAFTRWDLGNGAGLSVHNTGTALVTGNLFGTDAAGTAGLGNYAGLIVQNGSTVGGTTADERNVASGNVTGMAVNGPASIFGNYVGLTPAGTAALPNGIQGILVAATAATIGGAGPGQGNVISGNGGFGVRIVGGSSNTVKGNRIGTSPFGGDLGNGSAGVSIFGASGNTVGGTVAVGDGNVIAFNSRGVVVESGTGNAIRGNDISDNDGLGIDLGPGNGDGVTLNDPAPDDDLGPNNLQNYPVLTSAVVNPGLMTVSGGLTSAPSTTYSIDVFTTPTCDPVSPVDGLGHGEGGFYNGRFNVTTNGAGTATFSTGFGFGGAPGQAITATATDPAGNTSEFSACVISTAGDAAPTVSLTSPVPGALLRGTVTVSADAADDVGVQSVEFLYGDGGPLISIGTDTTAPYSASFDSTAVANTLRGGATVYARATDTGGNTTESVGNSVMVDNPSSRIVFETNRDGGNSDIYIMEPNGNDGITRLTTSAAVDTRPSLSPDGSLIAWQRDDEIWLMNSDGTNQQPLTSLNRDAAPAFSPDGTKIAFERDPPEDMNITHDIWVMNADGTNPTNLTNVAGNDVSATWSPDGTKLAFDSDRSGNRDIFTMNADGTGQTGLVGNSPQIDVDPDWSPDGQKLLFASGRGGGGTVVSVWSANADGSGSLVNVTNATIFDADPAWSPTGDRIVFTRDSGGQTFNLHLAAADGTTALPTRITFAGSTQRNSFADWGSLVADQAQPGPVFTVTTADDHGDAEGCTDADCTLREAIDAANARPNNADYDPDEIRFAILGSGAHTITLQPENGPLPPITEKVILDGTTQTGFVAEPLIFLDGSALICIECINHDGIRVSGGVGTTIRGLAIVNFDHRGIVLAPGSSSSVVEGSWIGIDQFGPAASAGNDLGGIRIEGSSGNRIGGPLPEQRVSLGSNGNFGGGQIDITGFASGNVVQGSYIGLNPDGAFTYDTEDGVLITSGASGNTIGGDSGLGEGNLVYGFYGRGVVLDGAGADNVIAGNTIGLSEDGAIGEAPEVGIDVVASPDNDIGDSVSPPGFASPSRGNVVVGADTVGIQVGGGSGGTRIAGNFVGVHRSISSVDFGNVDGVVVVDSGVTIGPGNTIAFNTANGVEIDNEVSAGNRIVANSIHDNGGLGIDLQSFANNGLAAPTITSATTAGAETTVDGTVTAPAGTYFVEFFSNDACDTSGAGEGETFLSFGTAVVDGSGSGSYTQDLPALPVGTVLTATTTSAATKDTSEFSTCATVAAGSTETVVTLEPVADTYVSGTQPDATFGSADHFDTYGGFSASCVPHSAPAYGLLRFNLSTLPTGQIADARIVLTSRAGYAQDGDGNHHVIRLSNDSWTEAGVTWNTRPPDGTVAPGNPLDATGNDIRLSNRALGADYVWRSSCSTDFAGDQTKVFPTNSQWTKTFAAARADMIAAVTAERDGDDLLSVETYNPNCVSCPAGANKAYWARYYSREAANPALRPKLVVTYETSVQVTSYTATPADPSAFSQVAIEDVPTSVLLARPSNTASSPLGDTPLGDTPLGDTPLGDTPLGDTPLGDTSLGLDNLIAELRTVPLSSLPLLREGGWPAVLANTALASRALQNVSLGDVFLLTPRPAVLDGQGDDDITLADLDLSRSSLGDVLVIAYALGNGVTLAELEGAFSNGQLDPDLQRWCTVTNTNCSATSILALGLRGAPLGDTPLGDTPLGDTPLGDTPLGDTPLGDTPLGDTPLGDTPLGDTPLGDTPLGDTPLGDTDFSRAPLSDTPLGDTPLGDTPLGDTPLGDTPLGDTPLGDTQFSALANCAALFTDCPNDSTDTLRAHRQFLRSGVTISDLIAALTPAALSSLTLSDVLDSIPDEYAYTLAHAVAVITDASGLTLADLVASLPNPNDFTLNDLLAAVLRAGAEWERIDLAQPELARVATGSDVVSLTADLTISGFTSSPLTFRVDLPRGWTAAGTPPWIESVPPGAATALELVSVERTPDGGTRHTLRTQFAVGGNQRAHFDTKPGATLGLASPTLAVTVAGNDPVDAPAAFVEVQEAFEPANNDPATAPILAPDTLYVSHLTSATDTDYYRVTVPATGTRTTIHLSHLPEDYDLVVYGRQGVTPLVSGGDAPPLETPVLGDSGAPITHLTDALPAETLDDLALLDRQVLGVSAFRTTEDEAVVAISDGAPGEYVLQVTGYNGASSVEPYMLRVESKAPRLAPTCQPRYPGLSFGSAPGVSLATIPADVDTLFLANGPQLAAGGGQSVLDWFSTTNLTALRNTGHPSALVRLQDDPAVRSAYTAWNLQPCSTARANAVVTAITTVLRTIRAARPALRHLVLLGADTALPFARLDDLTTVANEADYASTFARTDDLYGALFEHKVLSDDPYATTDPIPYLQRQLFVPQLAVGRLVETAAQITGTLDRFLAFGGVLDPSSARTSGYDFLKDGANGVAAAFADVVGAPQPPTTPPLIGDLWTRATLRNALGTNTGLFGMNGHADHGRLQPARDADGDGVFESTDLFSAADLPASLQRAVVFSMGCHSGLSASDASVAGAAAADWAQAFAGKGAAAYAGNLGYGYGDTVTVAYSEALNVRLAEGLRDGLQIGEALVEAKQGYLADLGLVGIYDEKAMSELALYGLPMWSLASGAQAAAASATEAAADEVAAAALPAGVTRLSTDTDPVTGLVVDRYRSQPTLTPQTVTGPFGGTFWTGPSGVEVKHLRPLQPKAQFEVAEDAHGLLITALESSDDSPINPVYARPIVDSSAAEPELPFADVAFPAKIQSLVSQRTRTGRRVSAVLVQGQFFSDDVVDANGAGVQRLFTRVDLDVLRSAGTDRLAPRLDSIEATVLPEPDLVSFSVAAVDLPGAVAGNVIRVLVAFRDETSPTWRFLDLARGTGSVWGGGASVSGERIEYFVQAVDRAGNVAVSTNKGLLFAGAPAPELPPAGGGVEPLISPSVGGTKIAGWFKPAAVLDIEADDGVAVAVSIDGGAFTPVSVPAEVPINGDGLHTVRVVGSNGYEATLLAPVDALPPTVVLDQPGATVPLNGAIPLAFRCADTASGVASCTATVDGTTRPVGYNVPTTPLNSTHTIVLTATDRVGRVTTQTFTYTVRSRGIVYTSSATGAGDVYTLPADAGPATVPTRLTATSFPEADPVWSPDSRRIAFASNRDGTWRIYVMDADGTDTTLVPTGTGDATQPAWSPDGTRIAFVSTRTGNPDVWVVNVTGSGLTRLTTDTKLDLSPVWAPNARIAWSNGPGGQLDIWSMTATGASKTRLTTTEDVNTDASWKSDGTIAFARRAKGGPRFEIWTMTSAGGSRTRIISSVRNDTQPSWLQDGRVAWATDRDDARDFDLFRATKTGNNWTQTRITNAPGDERAPNG